MSGISAKPTLLIAEDHEIVGQGLAALLRPRYNIAAIVRDGGEVVTAIRRYQPDLLLLDLTMPQRSGLEVLEDLTSVRPRPRVLIVTMHAEPALMQEAFRRGAHGFIPKDSSSDELLAAISQVLAGAEYRSPRLAAQPATYLVDNTGFLRLTPRQQEVVRMIGEGISSQGMAQALGLSRWTVHFHRKNIRRQLGIDSELEMHRFALLVKSNSVALPVVKLVDSVATRSSSL
jgi:DNA-binding NarL/FixJ family response regulator